MSWEQYKAYMKAEEKKQRRELYSRKNGCRRIWEVARNSGVSYRQIKEAWNGKNWRNYRSPWFCSCTSLEITKIKSIL